MHHPEPLPPAPTIAPDAAAGHRPAFTTFPHPRPFPSPCSSLGPTRRYAVERPGRSGGYSLNANVLDLPPTGAQELAKLPLGRQRRLIHDDASVIVIDLFSAAQVRQTF